MAVVCVSEFKSGCGYAPGYGKFDCTGDVFFCDDLNNKGLMAHVNDIFKYVYCGSGLNCEYEGSGFGSACGRCCSLCDVGKCFSFCSNKKKDCYEQEWV